MFGWLKKKNVDSESMTKNPTEFDFTDPMPLYTYFYSVTGINFEQKQTITTSKLIRFSTKYECTSFESLLTKLKKNPDILEDLINTLTVNETYFYREMDQIHFLTERIVNNPRHYRILCAPGSTGEEPYTIAIACAEAGINLNFIEIVSMDINTEAIKKGREAIFSKRALHKFPEALYQKYFTQEESYYHLNTTIKSRVQFHSANIFDPNIGNLGKFDIIFSRNMLIYFDDAKIKLALESLNKLAISSETIFFFGHADLVKPIGMLQEFYSHGIKYYRQK